MAGMNATLCQAFEPSSVRKPRWLIGSHLGFNPKFAFDELDGVLMAFALLRNRFSVRQLRLMTFRFYGAVAAHVLPPSCGVSDLRPESRLGPLFIHPVCISSQLIAVMQLFIFFSPPLKSPFDGLRCRDGPPWPFHG